MGIFIEDNINVDYKTTLTGTKYARFDPNSLNMHFNKDRQKWHIDHLSAYVYENNECKTLLIQLLLNFEVQEIGNLIEEIYNEIKNRFQICSDDI